MADAAFPHAVREIENCWITLSDGCRLAARIWLPRSAEQNPVPAVLEYLPYRKRDGSVVRDTVTHPYFAGHGYASVRVDMRGSGESDGLLEDEYLKQEQDDALEVIDWITAQDWCSGSVGMIGISWGGFNGLQVAARGPDALKAVVTICSTDDRYEDDIHFRGGCLQQENLGWGATMFSYSSRPPDPALVGEDWREIWMNRLENMPLMVETWLSHQRRDDYWKHGSVCEDFSSIKAAVLAVGGWGDAYSNAVPRLMKGLQSPVRAIIGPWMHRYPHIAKPEPRIGFLQECLRWWDHWLKKSDQGVMAEPPYRVYLMDSVRPQGHYDARPGEWIALDDWPDKSVDHRTLHLQQGGALAEDTSGEGLVEVSSDAAVGHQAGEYCIIWGGPEWPLDQRSDDSRSLCFETAPLNEPLALCGQGRLELEVSSDQAEALLAARLVDVAPGGEATRITYGVLNLSHRDSHEEPRALAPGKVYRISIKLDDVAYRVAKGHQLRLALSTSYWPLLWPSPQQARLTLSLSNSYLTLPCLTKTRVLPRPFEPVAMAPKLSETELRAPKFERRIIEDAAKGTYRIEILDDHGSYRIEEHGHERGSVTREVYEIHPDAPLSAKALCHWTQSLGRESWRIRTEAKIKQWADEENFYIDAELEAFEGEQQVFHRKWNRKVKRDFM